MGVGEFTKNGAFVATVFTLVVVLLPFGLEQIGETTELFEFPVRKTIMGFFSPSAAAKANVAVREVDWERYRQDLEAFSGWTGGQNSAVISPPCEPVVIDVVETEEKPVRRIWSVPVVSCTVADPSKGRKGYLFISGFKRLCEEGAVIESSDDLCGYEIVFIGERSVWFRVITDTEGDIPMGPARLPEFTRVEGASLVKGSRRYLARDAFPLASGGWLMIDSFLPPDGAVFKILDENRRVVTTLLCIVIGEKGDR